VLWSGVALQAWALYEKQLNKAIAVYEVASSPVRDASETGLSKTSWQCGFRDAIFSVLSEQISVRS